MEKNNGETTIMLVILFEIWGQYGEFNSFNVFHFCGNSDRLTPDKISGFCVDPDGVGTMERRAIRLVEGVAACVSNLLAWNWSQLSNDF